MGKKEFVLELVKKFKERINSVCNLDKIILFGSFARGDYGEWSDVDVVIVSEDFDDVKKVERPVALYDYWMSDYPVDFLCYTPGEFEKLKNRIGIIGQAAREGVEI